METGGATRYVGCAHYKCGVQQLSPCCGLFFGCRLCHDSVTDENESDPKLAHKMDRKLVTKVKCMACLVEQAPARACIACDAILGTYFCGVCNIFDNDGLLKKIFHCDGCGICRVGGRESYVHCDGCRMCVPPATDRAPHRCAKFQDSTCPVCLEDIFTSRLASISLPNCAHTMHAPCQRLLLENDNYKCPSCQKCMVDMSAAWRSADTDLIVQVMPAEYRKSVYTVQCNDCGAQSSVHFHVSGFRCSGCGSYNTAKVGGGSGIVLPLPALPAMPHPRCIRPTAPVALHGGLEQMRDARFFGLYEAAQRAVRTLLTGRASMSIAEFKSRRGATMLALHAMFQWIIDCSVAGHASLQQEQGTTVRQVAEAAPNAAAGAFVRDHANAAGAAQPVVGAIGQPQPAEGLEIIGFAVAAEGMAPAEDEGDDAEIDEDDEGDEADMDDGIELPLEEDLDEDGSHVGEGDGAGPDFALIDDATYLSNTYASLCTLLWAVAHEATGGDEEAVQEALGTVCAALGIPVPTPPTQPPGDA